MPPRPSWSTRNRRGEDLLSLLSVAVLLLLLVPLLQGLRLLK
jgi:hypothetical protein